MQAPAARARRWPAWLAALALALHLGVPGLCLAQSLTSAPLGELCSATGSADMMAPASPDGDEAGHSAGLDHCELCVVSAALWAPAPEPAAALTATGTARPAPAAEPREDDAQHWRPPPRGPPQRA